MNRYPFVLAGLVAGSIALCTAFIFTTTPSVPRSVALPPATAVPVVQAPAPTAVPPPPPTSAPATKPAVPTATTRPSGPSPEVQAYLDWLQPKVDSAGQSIVVMRDQFQALGQAPALFLNNEWKIKTGVALGAYRLAGNDMRSQDRRVPDAAVDVDRDVRRLGGDIVLQADDYIAGLDSLEPSRLDRGSSRMGTITQNMNQLAPKIRELRTH